MQFTFMDNSGKTLFVRWDAMTAQWTQEEMSLQADFPYDPGKVIKQGQWIAFQWLDEWQIFEVRNAKMLEPNHFQHITAESLVISELTDEHIDESEHDNKRADVVLNTVLNGTLWNVGQVNALSVSSADISRGSVWQAVNTIKTNWNVYIEPRYILDSNGNIGRYLDILPSEGVFRGLRLCVDKNFTDTTVTFDDSNVITAIKGYGANQYDEEDEDDEGTPLTFASVEWPATSTHPGKPYGQEWLIDLDATALYGRNGRPRRGYYQNTSIDNAETLLEKSWEALNKNREPDIQIEGTLTDLYRLGYADEPIRLHDAVIVEIKPNNFQMQREVVRLTVDLLNPSQTIPTIGNYIPNIVYINRDTNDAATGSSGGSGHSSGSSNKDDEFFTNISQNKYRIRIEAGQRINGDIALHSYIDVTATNIRQEVANTASGLYAYIDITATQIRQEVANTACGLYGYINVTATNIRQEVANTASGLYGYIDVTATQIRQEVSNTSCGLYAYINTTATNIRQEVANTASGLYAYIDITATQIRQEVANTSCGLYGYINVTATNIRQEVANTASGLQAQIDVNAGNISMKVSAGDIASTLNITPQSVTIDSSKINLNGYVTESMMDAAFADISQITVSQLTLSAGGYFTFKGYNVEWQSSNVSRVTLSDSHAYRYESSSGASYGTVNGRIVTGYRNFTINYMGSSET